MALQLNLSDSRIGLPTPDAYAKISGVLFDAPSSGLEIHVDIYASAAARHSNKEPIERQVLRPKVGYSPGEVDLETALLSGWRAAIYSWMKTLPFFSSGTDVIDPVPVPPVLVSAELLTNPWRMKVVLNRITLRDTPVSVVLHSDTAEVVVPEFAVIASGLLEAEVEVTVGEVTENKLATITATLDDVVLANSLSLEAL